MTWWALLIVLPLWRQRGVDFRKPCSLRIRDWDGDRDWDGERERDRSRDREEFGETERERERSLYRSLNNLLKIIRNMTECCPTPDCSLKKEKSQESLCLISHYYGWNCPNDSDIDYCDYPEPLSRTQWPHMAWPLATSAASFPPKPLLLTIPPLKHSSLTSFVKCHIIRKTFPGHVI